MKKWQLPKVVVWAKGREGREGDLFWRCLLDVRWRWPWVETLSRLGNIQELGPETRAGDTAGDRVTEIGNMKQPCF